MLYYPIFLDLAGRRVVVIGGNKLAHEKVAGLLPTDACITVIAASLLPALQDLVAQARIIHLSREYQYGDLQDAFLAISTLDEVEANARIFEEAGARNVAINVVDDLSHCSFIAPSFLRRGDLTVAISTGGKAPAMAVRLRQQLEAQIGDEYGKFLEIAGRLRTPLAEKYPDFETRKRLWYELVDSEVLDLIRAGNESYAQQRITEIFGI